MFGDVILACANFGLPHLEHGALMVMDVVKEDDVSKSQNY